MDIKAYKERVEKAVEYLKGQIDETPEIAIILGSGLSVIADEVEKEGTSKKIPYSEIPGFPISTAPGHKGELIFGKLFGKNVMLMNGRFHYYEGYSMKEVTFPIRVMQLLGVEILIVTNAAGGLNPDFEVGRPMIITDHINFMGDNPLIGPNVDEWGPRFPDMSEPYDKELIELAYNSARELGIPVYQGVYVAVTGPCFETPAELRMLRKFGADAVGMSTVPEVIVARHGQIRVLGISAITDRAVPEDLKPLTAEEVLEVAEKTGRKIAQIIFEVVRKL
ncbi:MULTISPECIES: purine-nucleoside phosphorylase [Thermotoga]|uniref:Purine nucleoside phosphorylase n=2 Tax=Thermotoga petrophila TaxID=93929 RepID=D2C871_THEP2|nr:MULTISPECIES: purine-nucleoside phosphorylase [Thermotoga]ADA67157.1 inosine guanosine and xanthosine phosphorylase family [Thermotoga petrophila RKU-10]KUK23818.1 MAG: Purine nucleoside phosphorylase [Thermotoga petrophila]ACB09434.1 inosine guanosine and xanthosine phosphorylase family [Thermotoga sp. RQ2]AGL50669.1 Purine nucleoside phosphorylase [Thermotoga maritima MSB8]AIY88390.1 purine nucleoside phosphorylase [Thermotoga sp. Cell2]